MNIHFFFKKKVFNCEPLKIVEINDLKTLEQCKKCLLEIGFLKDY